MPVAVFFVIWEEALVSKMSIAGDILHAARPPILKVAPRGGRFRIWVLVTVFCDIEREGLVGDIPTAGEVLQASGSVFCHLGRGPGEQNVHSR